MSRARHAAGGAVAGFAARAKGGGVEDEKAEVYAGKDSKTEEEAEGKRSAGGAVTRKRGGAIHMISGSPGRNHGNRPGRKRGGSVGADSSPLTSASKLTGPEKGSENVY